MKSVISDFLVIYIFILPFLFSSCQTKNRVKLNGIPHKLPSPPNGIEIKENLFGDETEVNNISYREYLYWIKKRYGKESNEYVNALPDKRVWEKESKDLKAFVDGYFLHPSYDLYPVVGLNYAQIEEYTNWRTNRVAEASLIQKGLIKPSGLIHPFTIERYLNGNFPWILKRESIIIPVFRIPTLEEWEHMAAVDSAFKGGVNPNSYFNKKVLRRNKSLFNVKDSILYEESDVFCLTGKMPMPVDDGAKNVNGLFHMIGNVAEIIQGKKVIGGSWNQSFDKNLIQIPTTFLGASAKVGFRNVSSYEVFEIE